MKTLSKWKHILAAATLVLLTACASSFEHQLDQEGKSVVLIGIETVPDFETNFLYGTVREVFRMAPTLGVGKTSLKGSRRAFFQENNQQDIWLAFSVEPGAYSLTAIREWAESEEIQIIRFGGPPEKTTDFQKAGVPLEFEVAPSEILYIGTLRASLTTGEKPALGYPLVLDVQKTYELDTQKAQRVMAEMKLPPANFRQVDLFAGRPEAKRMFDLPWSARPKDE